MLRDWELVKISLVPLTERERERERFVPRSLLGFSNKELNRMTRSHDQFMKHGLFMLHAHMSVLGVLVDSKVENWCSTRKRGDVEDTISLKTSKEKL